MIKTLKLSLNKYATIPHTLRGDPTANVAVGDVSVNLANLYHHYYLDSFGRSPPNPDPAQFEPVHFLLPGKDFRFQGAGMGISRAIKIHRSNELGQAFCRWFLHDHLNITYFAHVESLLGRQLHRAFAGFTLERSVAGDTPDYFCAESAHQVFLGEAKGRYSPISFSSKEFALWREQFSRVTYKDPSGAPRKIKGHIVATRFATEHSSSKVKSSILAEDPESPGRRPLDRESSWRIASVVISTHYSGIAVKMDQPLLAVSLANGIPLPEEVSIQAVAWEVVAGPLVKKRFIGGYFNVNGGAPIQSDGRVFFRKKDIFQLDAPSATFFGLEESIFRQIVETARRGADLEAKLSLFEEIVPFYSGFSILRDGSVLGPIEFFSPIEIVII